jgi:transglutaminase-like putative cysteine protease
MNPAVRAHIAGLTDGKFAWTVDEGPPWPTTVLRGTRAYEVKPWGGYGDARRLKLLREMVLDYGRDPRMRELVINQVLRPAGVLEANRNYKAQNAALLAFVQNKIAYLNEPGELIQSPWHTLKVRHGDCFAEGTLVLRDDFELIPIEAVEPGMRIWGRDAWSEVTAWGEKGTLPVDEITLNNGSKMRLTPDHKVYVKVCEMHGALCPDLLYSAGNCKKAGRTFMFDRIRVSELREGMEILTPERIAFGREDMDPDRALVEGLYLADGWADTSRFSISGLDGHPKEDQKRRVEHICASIGIPTRWHRKYLAVNDAAWAARLAGMGKRAWEKAAASLDLTEPAACALLEGLMADAGRNTHGGGMTYSSTSYTLALQTRILHKMFGRTCSWRTVENHGGFGQHPIHRLGVRVSTADRVDGHAEKRLRVKSIVRAVAEVPCYDITTSDHYVYLPEADATVSNCDDLAVVLATMAESIRLPWRFVLAGKTRRGDTVRWAEGTPQPRGVSFHHIYLHLGNQPFRPTQWFAAEPTVRGVPLGWDVTIHGMPMREGTTSAPAVLTPAASSGMSAGSSPASLPELSGPFGSARARQVPAILRSQEPKAAEAWYEHLIDAVKWISIGVATAVITARITKQK